jgi:carboxymethylenebutenolidase
VRADIIARDGRIARDEEPPMPPTTAQEEIRFDAGDAVIRGVWTAAPESAGNVVLIPDVRGVSDLYLRLARRLADVGLGTLVLDLYSREGTPDLPDMDTVFRCIEALPDARVLGDVGAAVRHLAQRDGDRPRPTAIAGFCLGGQYAIMAACQVPRLSACASFYGMLRYDRRPAHKPASPLDLAPSLACPLLGLYGSDDPLIPAEDRLALESILRRERKEFSLHVFGGAGHAFLNDTRPADHRPEAAAVAWDLATAFLLRHARVASRSPHAAPAP